MTTPLLTNLKQLAIVCGEKDLLNRNINNIKDQCEYYKKVEASFRIHFKHLFLLMDLLFSPFSVCLVKNLLPAPLEVQQIDVLGKPMRFLALDLSTKLKTSESTFWCLCGMVVYKVLKSKVEIDLAFFLTLILFSLVTTGKEFCK